MAEIDTAMNRAAAKYEARILIRFPLFISLSCLAGWPALRLRRTPSLASEKGKTRAILKITLNNNQL